MYVSYTKIPRWCAVIVLGSLVCTGALDSRPARVHSYTSQDIAAIPLRYGMMTALVLPMTLMHMSEHDRIACMTSTKKRQCRSGTVLVGWTCMTLALLAPYTHYSSSHAEDATIMLFASIGYSWYVWLSALWKRYLIPPILPIRRPSRVS